jgi:hypothetical protein
MPNKLIRVFDNIGFNFTVTEGGFKPSSVLNSYNKLNNNHVGYLIPYIARNANENIFEVGVGEVKLDGFGDIFIERIQVVKSSSANQLVNFPNNNNEFYIFANQSSFDSGLNNVIVVDKDKDIDPVSAIYLIDTSNNSVSLKLPESSQINNIVLEFKLLSYNYPVNIKDYDNNQINSLSSTNEYLRLVSNGDRWILLNSNTADKIKIQSIDNTEMVNALSSQFNDTQMYWDSESQRIFIGGDSASNTNVIIPSSGNYPFIANNKRNGSDFVVYGSGSYDKNLFFSYDGRVGINIPSGSRPSTVFHIVNTVCQEGLRLENRTSCYPANITLYHKPSTSITNNSVVGQINLAAKNVAGSQTNYSKIESRAVNTTTYGEKGALDIIVVSGVTGIKTVETSVDSTIIGYSGNRLQINNGSNATWNNGSSQINLTSSAVNISGNSVNFIGNNANFSSSISTTGASIGSLYVNSVFSTTLSSGSLLTVDSDGKLTNSPITISSLGSIGLSIPQNKILSSAADGSITGIRSLDDYFLTESDIIWNKYSARSGTCCLRQVVFTEPVPDSEFSVGDQIVLSSSGLNDYRTITSIDSANNSVVGLLIDQNVNQSGTILISSITKGGYLTIQKNVDDGIISNSSSNTLSIRPLVDTTFNAGQKDINFSVYGLDDDPALFIKANTGRTLIPSGIYSSFATGRSDMFSTIINSTGVGLSNQYSSANYAYDNSRNIFSGLLSSVGTNGLPSYYGTYDQNGNAAEWIEKQDIIESRDSIEFVAGGAYSTTNDATIGSNVLKSIESLTRASGYNYVGFRIASLQGITDQTYISSTNGLNMSFVGVNNPKNIEDSNPVYIKNPAGSPTTYSQTVINNLGVVNNIYRIGKYEVTNTQYCAFLNAIAKTNDRGLYDTRMATNAQGGITRISNAGYEYSVKSNMADKPVIFVSYLSAIRFINWLHNGAITTLNESDIDYNLSVGAYTVYSIGTNSYNIVKSSYRKYWLPNLNEWYKAAYYRPVNSNDFTGTSTVSIKRSEPEVIATGIDITGSAAKLYANLSVSGWLYVDHIVVGDGTIRSAKSFTGLTEPVAETPTSQATTTISPATNVSAQYNNPYASVFGSVASCVSAGCSFEAKPLRLDEDTISLCSNNALSYNEIPWWCDTNNNGPGWFN